MAHHGMACLGTNSYKRKTLFPGLSIFRPQIRCSLFEAAQFKTAISNIQVHDA